MNTQSSPPNSPALAAQCKQRTRFAVRGLKSLGYGAVIALCLAAVFNQTWWRSLAYSCSISVACWFCIDVSRTLVARWVHSKLPPDHPKAASQWPGWPWMMLIILLGTIVGFSVGNLMGDLITGGNQPGYLRGTWFQALGLLLGSLIPGMAITYWFYSREVLAAQQALVETAQRQAAENQLKLLESQLEPHMLFNTLANLRVLIGMDPPRAQAMLDQLIAFLRATLSASRSAQHPLAAEFARLADYLALMQVRMGDRLQTQFEMPADLADVPVPPLLLQPLVENAISHGLEPKVGGGRIEVSASREAGQLVLRVHDTGVGLSDAPSTGTRFGLVQVRERLATLYAGRASLELADAGAAAGGGALATIRLPIAV